MGHTRFKTAFKIDTLPFDDDQMEYDVTTHRYTLQDDYFQTKTGINLTDDLGSDSEAQIFLDEISDRYYDIVYSTANPQYKQNNIRIKEYRLAKDHALREFIVKTMVSYARASINTDIDKIGDEQRINLEISLRNAINMADDIPSQLRRILYQSGIMFTGVYQYQVDDDYRVGY